VPAPPRARRRHGAPIEGLQPGSLLVAAPGLEDPLFSRAVVLVTHTGRGGACGVLLTQVRAGPAPAGWARVVALFGATWLESLGLGGAGWRVVRGEKLWHGATKRPLACRSLLRR
jgi:hypothetical protein